MLRELARASPLARTDRFDTDHPRVLVALESLRRHGYHGAASGTRIPSLMRLPPRDQSRRFAVIAITLTLGVWIVLPLLVTLSLTR